jgi:hypothetical protein
MTVPNLGVAARRLGVAHLDDRLAAGGTWITPGTMPCERISTGATGTSGVPCSR